MEVYAVLIAIEMQAIDIYMVETNKIEATNLVLISICYTNLNKKSN